MTTFQKIIKYAAIAFGTYLCVMIISGIIFAITSIVGITLGINAIQDRFNNNNNGNHQEILEQKVFEYSDIKNLNIDLSMCKLVLKTEPSINKIKVETTNDINKINCKQNFETLNIEDDAIRNMDFFKSENIVPEVILYIPENYEFLNVEISAKINDTNIEGIIAKKAEIETGSGRFVIDNIETEKLDVDGAAGEIIIKNSKTKNLDLDAGVGNIIVNTEVLGFADVDAGVGRLELNLKGNKSNYKIKPSVGIGGVTIDNKIAKNNEIIGNGNQKISISSGIGEVVVNFIENQV